MTVRFLIFFIIAYNCAKSPFRKFQIADARVFKNVVFFVIAYACSKLLFQKIQIADTLAVKKFTFRNKKCPF